jgi:hypothetical protein
MSASVLLLCVTLAVAQVKEKSEAEKVNLAKVEVKTLTAACEQYYAGNRVFPDTLKALTLTQPNGGAPFFGPAKLLDPWKNPYQYDPKGPKNGGKKPDVWTKTPKGEVVGNWPEKKEK